MSLSDKNKKKAKRKENRARSKAYLAGKSGVEIVMDGNRASRKSSRRSAMKQTLGESISKSFKSGKAEGSTVRNSLIEKVSVNANNPISKGAAAAGRSYKSAGNTMSALKKAALKKAQQASAAARKGKKRITGK